MKPYTLLTTLIICLLFIGCSKTDEEQLKNLTIDGNITLVNQTQIDAFIAEHKNIKNLVINGDLNIVDDTLSKSIKSISGLDNLVGVTGNFTLNTPHLSSINGLKNLTYVGKKFDIWNIQTPLMFPTLKSVSYLVLTQCNIEDMQGFKELTTVDSLRLKMNSRLKTLNGLPVKSSYKYLDLYTNTLLKDISILSSVTAIEHDLILINPNRDMDYSPLSNLQKVNSLTILSLNSNTDISFDNLTQLNYLSIQMTGDFKKIRLDNVSTIEKIILYIADQDHISLRSLKTVTETVDLFKCLGSNMSFLQNVTQITRMRIAENQVFLFSSGLENLDTINDFLYLLPLNEGFSFSGLINLKFVGSDLTLSGNFYDQCLLKPLIMNKYEHRKFWFRYQNQDHTDNFIQDLKSCK